MKGMIQYQCVKCSRIIAVHPATVYVTCCSRYARRLMQGELNFGKVAG
ncbi:hypothetical protein JIR001_16690 [Polycladomyces abyssicola]|uniref:Uncharacterized protein n=1 Tax=Polycladomyces abyssicola TaxID=1125966 RepID=A0A8D5ZNZ7_9BACL|nr:hypothetical protein [Polycladomyces abyssicola]BCU81886.1 hypothetical protein JIR001_16690 [Polycladomyces abyssicola]